MESRRLGRLLMNSFRSPEPLLSLSSSIAVIQAEEG